MTKKITILLTLGFVLITALVLGLKQTGFARTVGTYISSAFLGQNVAPTTDAAKAKVASSGAVLGLDDEFYRSLEQINFNLPSFFNDYVNISGNLTVGGNTTLEKDATVSGSLAIDQDLTVRGQRINFGTATVTGGNLITALTAGSGIAVSTGTTPTISNSGVLSLQGRTGALALEAGDNIKIDGLKISAEVPDVPEVEVNTFKNFAVSGQSTLTASGEDDTFTFANGPGITITTNATNKTTTIGMIGTCSAGEVLKWNGVSNTWVCGNDAGSSGLGIINVEESDVVVSPTADTLDYNGNDFSLTEAPTGEINIAIDYSNSNITRKNVAETLTQSWNFSNGIQVSSLSTGVVQSNGSGVLSSSALNLAGGSSLITGVLPQANGGTGFSTYSTGDLIYASATDTLAKRSIGSNGQVLSVTGGLPVWSDVNALCATCVVTDPNATQVITPTDTAATGLSIAQIVGGTADVFSVTNNTGSTKYLQVNSSGNVSFSGNASVGGNLSVTGTSALTGNITAGGTISGLTGITSSGTITFSGLGTGVVQSNGSGVLSSTALNLAGGSSYVTGTLPQANGGTGFSTYTTGDIIYASAANTLSKRSVGTNGTVLTVSGGVPTWTTISGGSGGVCTDCIVNDPGSTQTITPTIATATGLTVAQAASGSVDIFSVTNNDGSSKFLQINSSGNIIASNLSGSGNRVLYTTAGGQVSALTDGGSNQVLTTNGSGTLSWTSLAGAGGVTGSGSNGLISFWTGTSTLSSNANFFWDDSNSRLGIGDITPAAALTVGSGDAFQVNSSGAIAAATGITSSGTIILSGLSTAGLVTNTSGGVLGTTATIGASYITADALDFTEFKDALTLDASTDIGVTGTNVFSITNSGTGNSLVVNDQASDTTPFVVDASGNVGIGVSSPGVKLDVSGQIRSTLDTTVADSGSSGASGALRLRYNSWTTGHGANLQFDIGSYDSAGNVIRSQLTNAGGSGISDLIFYGKDSTAVAQGTLSEYMRIEAGGNIGIGNTNPSYKLDIADSGTTSGIRGLNVAQTGAVSGTGYAGYFSKTGASTTNIGLYAEASGATNNYAAWFQGPTHYTRFTDGYLLDTSAANLYILDGVVFRGDLANDVSNWAIRTDFNGGTLELSTDQSGGTRNTNQVKLQADGTTYFGSGNIGIGDSSPASLFTVGSGDLFQVNSSGAIASATGITSSGTITLSGLSTAGLVTNTSGGVLGTTTTIGASYITADSLDFTEFKDAMTLDASTDIAAIGTNVFSLTNSGTGNSLVVNDQSSDTSPFIVDASGNVGIQTSTANDALDVAGNIDSSGYYKLAGTKILDLVNNGSLLVGHGAGNSIISDMDFNTLVGKDAGYSINDVGADSNTAIGYTSLYNNISGRSNVAVGLYAGGDLTSGNYNVFIGNSAGEGGTSASGSENVAIGYQSFLNFTSGVANAIFGYSSGQTITSGDYNTFLGSYIDIEDGTYSNSIGIGANAYIRSSNQLVIGGSGSSYINDAYIGGGIRSTSPQDLAINATGGQGSDIAGADLTLAGGKGTGSGLGGALIFSTAGAGSTGSTPNTLSERMRIDSSGNVNVGGDTTPNAQFTVGSTSQFQVNSSGAIAAATGVTSSGTITLSGLSTAGLVTNTSGGVLGTTSTIGASYITADSLDFTEFKDAMTLDTSTDIGVTGTNVLSVTNSGTGNSLVVNDQASDTTPFVVDASGFVGIGTSSPTNALDVGGKFVVNTTTTKAALGYTDTSLFSQTFGINGSLWLNGGIVLAGGSTITPQGGSTINIGGGNTVNINSGSIYTSGAGGNVGIGDTSPAALLTVGSGDLFRVNSSGAIAAATGIASSGTITFSGLSSGITSNGVCLNASNQLITCSYGGGTGTMNTFTAAGDSGGGQTITDNNTLSILGGTNGIDTVDSITDTITLNLDTTEIGSTTFGSGSGLTWTFDASAGTDPTIAFANNAITFTANSATFTGAITAPTSSNTINSLIINAGALSGVTGFSQASGAFTVNGSGAVALGTGTNNVSIGNSSGTFALTSSGGLNVTTGGALTGVASIDTISTSATAIGFAGAGTITSNTTSALTLDSGSSGTVNLGTGNNAKTINVGTGTAGNTINVGTDNTVADTIGIGSALDTVSVAGTTSILGATTINGSGSLATNIGTGTSTGTITIGRTTGTDLALNDSNWNISGAGAANFGSIGATTPGTGAFTTLSSTGATTIGNNSSTVAIDSSVWDISSAGVASGLTGISSSGTITFSGISSGTASNGVCVNASNQLITCSYGGGTMSSFNTGGDTGSGSIINGDTLVINGGTNGIDTALSGDTYTLNLDTTEIGTSTFGSGSGITWTFDAGATDPTLAFASDQITATAGTAVLSGTTTLTASSLSTLTTAATLGMASTSTLNCADCIDFDDMKDSMTIDAATDINLGANAFTIDLDSTGDFSIRDVTADIATFSDNGAISFTPTSGQGITNTIAGAGNFTVTTATGTQTFTSSVVSGTTTTSGFVFDATAINSGTGMYLTSDSITSGKLLQLATTGNTFTSGTILDVTTTSTSLTSGGLGSFDWSPGSSTTATGDLFSLNIGTNGNIGSIFNVKDSGTSVFSVTESAITANLPANFNAAGDVSFANNLALTNQTASYIRSNAPLYLEAGEIFESNDLTLRTYNSGQLVIDAAGGTNINSVSYIWPSSQAASSGYVLTNNGSGTLSWATAGSMSSFTAAGDTGSSQTISNSDTFSILGDTNGIDTVASATDTITLNLDTTEIGTTTFGSGSNLTWTFNSAGATDPTFTAGTGTLSYGLVDNTASAFTLAEGSNNYFRIDTTNSAPVVTLDTLEAGGTMNFGSSNFGRTINIGTGTGADTINIGTGATTADAITVGNTGVATTFTFNSGATTQTPMAFNLDALTTGTGLDFSLDGLTTGIGMKVDDNTGAGLSTGTMLYINSVSTALTTATNGGSLGYFNWNPGSSTTATGDLFRINIGSSGSTTGNLFNITDNGTSIFSVSETGITSSAPHQFTAAGDVGIAYDLQFTNQTASYIKSNAPLIIDVGESFESNDLTLQTYNSGDISLDTGATGSINLLNSVAFGSQIAFTAADTTPDVSAGSHFITAGTATISDFDAGTSGTLKDGQIIFIECNSAVTFDVTASGLNGGSADLACGAGDMTTWMYDGTDWNLIAWVDDTDAQTGADLAEWYASNETLNPGEVVSIDKNQPGEAYVKKTTAAKDSAVVGVVATKPGITLGEPVNGKAYAIALAGRVPVKVSTSNGPIEKGDYLTTSGSAGIATKATSAGPTIGKALTAYNGSGTGEVIVFVNVSWFDPDAYLASLSNVNITPNSSTDKFSLANAGNLISRIGLFSDAAIGNLSTGFIDAKKISLDGTNIMDLISNTTQQVAQSAGTFTQEDVNSLLTTAYHLQTSADTLAITKKMLAYANVNIQGDLEVFGQTFIKGKATFEDESVFNKLASFVSNAVFKGKVSFEDQVAFNKDTAGIAIIEKNSDKVTVIFDKEYDTVPLVSATMVHEGEASSSAFLKTFYVSEKTKKGFTIKLDTPQSEDVSFNWIAIAVSDPKISKSSDATPAPSVNPVVQEGVDKLMKEATKSAQVSTATQSAQANTSTP